MSSWFNATIDRNWARRIGNSEKSKAVIEAANAEPYQHIFDQVTLRSLGGLSLRFDSSELTPHTNGLWDIMLAKATAENIYPIQFAWLEHSTLDLAEPQDGFVVMVKERDIMWAAKSQRRQGLADQIAALDPYIEDAPAINENKWAFPLSAIVRASDHPPYTVPHGVVEHLTPEVLFSAIAPKSVE